MSAGSEFSTRGKPCSNCGHRKSSHTKTATTAYCQVLFCWCEGFTARKISVETNDRTPSAILADLFSIASRVAEEPDEIVSSYGDRLGMLCAEMEKALASMMFAGSIAGRKK